MYACGHENVKQPNWKKKKKKRKENPEGGTNENIDANAKTKMLLFFSFVLFGTMPKVID